MRSKPLALTALLIVSMVGLAVAPASAQQGDAVAGTHVTFESNGSSVSDYAVDGDVLVESATMLSSSDAHHQDGRHVGEDVALIGDVEGSEVASVDTSARARVAVEFASGGTMESHDNRRGVARFVAGDGNQVVQVNVSEDADVNAESDGRLVVETDDGPHGAFILIGDGELGENRNGQVNANLYSGSALVYRQYGDERSDGDEAIERMIEEGTATAEVYVQRAGEDDGDTVADVVEYGEYTAVEVASEGRNAVELTVERSVSHGAVILANVDDEAVDDVADLEVTVDGEAAAEADSYGEVEATAIEGGDPSYHVAGSSSTEATTDVAVGIDEFSERDVALTTGGGSDGDGAGLGALGALLALASSMVVRYRS